MASWTDTTPLKFSPYVSQLPVIETVSKISQEKQQQYNQGIQKIQSNIDNIAGFDVIRDVDKNHLQSKLNELGNNLKIVAAGDFSNFQLVNSIGGMVNQIAQDPYIQSARSSTANIRQQHLKLEEDREKGTLTPHAEYAYQTKENNYLSNPSLKDEKGRPVSFSGKYIPSWDIDKNLSEAIKSVGDSKWTADNVFKLDPSTGRPLRNIESVKDPKTGKIVQVDSGPMYSDVAIREMRAGKFNENVLAAINSVLDRPEAKQELAMRGIYNYRGYNDINDFISQYQSEKDTGVSLLRTKKLELQAKFASEKDVKLKEQYQTLINNTDANIQSLTNVNDSLINEAKQYGSLDAYKVALQTQKTRNLYMKSGVTEQYSKEYIKNIPYEVAQEKVKRDRDWWAQQQTVGQGWERINISQKTLDFEKEKWKYDPKNPMNPLSEGTRDTPITGGVTDNVFLGNFMDRGNKLTDTFNSARKQFVLDWMITLEHTTGGGTKTNNEILKEFNDAVSNDPEFIKTNYERAKRAISTNPGNLNYSNLVSSLPMLNRLEKALVRHSNEIDIINNDQRVINAGGKEIDTKQLEKGLPSYNITYNDRTGFLGAFGGNEITKTVTPKDIMDANIVMQVSGGPFSSESSQKLYTNAKESIEKKFGLNVMAAISNMGLVVPTGNPSISYIPSINSNLLKSKGITNEQIATLTNISKLIGNQRFLNIIAAKEEVLKEKMMGDLPLYYSPYPKDAKEPERTSANEAITTILNKYKDGKIDVSKFNEFFAGKTKDSYSIRIGVDRGTPLVPNQAISLNLFDKESLVQSLPITMAEAKVIKGPMWRLPENVSDVQRAINFSPGKNSSNSATSYPTDPDAHTSAYYDSSMFGNLNRSDVIGADIFINGMGMPNVYLYIKNEKGDIQPIPYKEGGKVLPANFVNVDEADRFINSLNAATISQIINQAKPVVNNIE